MVFGFVKVDGNVVVVVCDVDWVVVVNDDMNCWIEVCLSFVDGVVDEFVDYVVEICGVIGVIDVYVGVFVYCFEVFEDFDVVGGVVVIFGGCVIDFFGYVRGFLVVLLLLWLFFWNFVKFVE